MKFFGKGMCATFLLVMSISQAQAQIINFSLDGVITSTATYFGDPNPFGLNVGNVITATGSYDDSAFTGSGFEHFDLIDINITVGTGSYNMSDADWSSQYLTLFYGDFHGLAYDSADWGFSSFTDNFNGRLSLFEGEWRNYSEVSAVPVPAAAWLFGSGLIGLVGLARRKAA